MGSGSPLPGGILRVLLVGFMGSGKSTVGPLVAARLGWPFLDFDDEIERRSGASVEDLFRLRGEAGFRRLEHEVARDLLGRGRVVLASGGGWPVAEGRMEALDASTLTVWLRTDARTALERVRRGGGRTRPLLEGPEPLERAHALIATREPRYRLARLHIETGDATPGELAQRIIEHMEAAAPPGDGR